MLLCMRTTIELNDSLFRQLKQEAARRGMTLREVVNERLRGAAALSQQRNEYHFSWKPFRGGHLQPGVRLNDRDSLFDLMDGR